MVKIDRKNLIFPKEYLETRKFAFMLRIQPDLNGCWIWDGSLNPFGYGCFSMGRYTIGAHRASYLIFKGLIPEGILVCHQCDIPNCVNPEHLFLGTDQDNVQDMIRKGRSNYPKDMDFCKRGLHKMEGANVLKSKKERRGNYWRGGRQCRACKMDVNKRYVERKKLKAA